MKKNKAMRAAGILLIATLLTTCLTAGTFAKYTTTDSATDSARVAKFGVVVTANGSLFGQQYVGNAAAEKKDLPMVYGDNTSATVQINADDATAGNKVVAPGTKNDTGMGFAVSGTPEVDVKVTLNVTKAKNVRMNKGTWGAMVNVDANVTDVNFASYLADATTPLYTSANAQSFDKVAANATFDADKTYYQLHDMTVLTDDYFPVQYNLSGTTDNNVNGDIDTDSLKAVIEKYATAVGGTFTGGALTAEKTFKANTDLTSNTGLDLGAAKITWKWAIANDGKNPADTLLGDMIAGDAFAGVVVYDNNTTAGEVPNEFAKATKLGDTADFDNDPAGTNCNLYTALDMSITVEQVD